MGKSIPKLFFKADEFYLDVETEDKGYRPDVLVQLPNMDIIEVFFYDPIRLQQDIGKGVYLAKPGLIILKKVNKKSMEAAVLDLYEKGFFNYFTPRRSFSERHFEEEI